MSISFLAFYQKLILFAVWHVSLGLALVKLGFGGWVYRCISCSSQGSQEIQREGKSYGKDYGCSLMALHGTNTGVVCVQLSPRKTSTPPGFETIFHNYLCGCVSVGV